jgi:hypothetical protein
MMLLTDRPLETISRLVEWQLNQWDEYQHQEWKAFMKRGHEKFLIRVPSQRKAIEMYEKRKK